jgi:HK97 family phage major capsid protein
MAKVTRPDVSNLILPDEVSETILRGVAEQSIIAQYARTRPMRAQNVKLTEAEVQGANVFWVGEGARKSTDAPSMASLTWSMSAAELAVIIPMDENVYDDANLDLWELYRPAIETAVAHKLDAAALFGTDAPTEWGTTGIVPLAKTAGNDVEIVNASVTDVELLEGIAGTGAATADGLLQMIEDDGYDPNGFLAYVRFRSKLRNLKDADNRYVFGGPTGAGVPGELFSVPINFLKSDIWNATAATGAYLVAGDWNQAVLGTRQGLRYKMFDQGVITDGAGNVVYSLMENDMIALRVTGRFGFKIICDNTADGQTLAAGEDFPFAVLREDDGV